MSIYKGTLKDPSLVKTSLSANEILELKKKALTEVGIAPVSDCTKDLNKLEIPNATS